MTPYAGIGAGIIKIEDDVKAAYNIIIGTNLKYGKEDYLRTLLLEIFFTISLH
jgi:hypothetical protein